MQAPMKKLFSIISICTQEILLTSKQNIYKIAFHEVDSYMKEWWWTKINSIIIYFRQKWNVMEQRVENLIKFFKSYDGFKNIPRVKKRNNNNNVVKDFKRSNKYEIKKKWVWLWLMRPLRLLLLSPSHHHPLTI